MRSTFRLCCNFFLVGLAFGCEDPGAAPLPDGSLEEDAAPTCPMITSATASVLEAEVGESITLEGTANGVTDATSLLWSVAGGSIENATSAHASFACAEAGAFEITLALADGACADSRALGVTCRPPAPRNVILNEIETSGGMPGDWVELYNPTNETKDISGFVLKDADDTHAYTLPAGTTLAAGAYLVLDESVFGYGFGTSDSARLFDATGALVDIYEQTAHSSTTIGRCPNGTGSFVMTVRSTKGTINACEGDVTVGLTYTAWPGSNGVMTGDAASTFGGNLSDLAYQPADGEAEAVLWAVQNNPSRVHRLVSDGSTWARDAGDWAAGKALHYPGGTGSPDAEGITRAEAASPAVYVVAERDNEVLETSRLSVLRFDTSVAGTSMTATHEWNLTADFPSVGPNGGIEAIAWVPDAFLVAHLFRDERTGLAYLPATYPNHGDGLFFVALETSGLVHAYALNHATSAFTRVATILTGQIGIMGLSFDADSGYLWSRCDDACDNRAVALGIDGRLLSPTFGELVVRGAFERPSSLGNYGYEGMAIVPDALCTDGSKVVFFVDDAETEGHALRWDRIPCADFLPVLPAVIAP